LKAQNYEKMTLKGLNMTLDNMDRFENNK